MLLLNYVSHFLFILKVIIFQLLFIFIIKWYLKDEKTNNILLLAHLEGGGFKKGLPKLPIVVWGWPPDLFI